VNPLDAIARARLIGLLVVLGISACAEVPTAPEADDPALEAVLAESTDGARAGDAQRPLIGRLLEMALTRLGEESGAEAARAVRANLAPLAQAVADARAAGDREAYRRAVLAFETQAARVVVRVMGPPVVRRVMGHATDRVARMGERLRAAEAGGGDVTAAAAVLRQASSTLREARLAADTGDLPGALRLAARAIDLLGG
jgi:hypothetical protein